MYIYIAFLPYRCYCYDSSFTNLLIADIDFLFDLDDLVYNILGIPTMPLALAPIPAKLAKITPAIRRTAACKAKRRESAKAYAIVEGLRRSKCTAGSDAGRYTTDSGFTADKDDNNAYNRAYMPPADIEEEEENSSGDNNSVNSGTSDSTDKGKGSNMYEYSKGVSRCEDIPLYKQ
ncbi:hypothetical protein P8C59_007383 [Phyllachora maydis]|uniref:Uncharacterized protein n=1 Tax=Phyllachora maydis TaxID=1825666 RepID=A0AAD9I9E7_9PEZI|nr:hypothetical protein P8C59_007383 [Phyllachora maydis]